MDGRDNICSGCDSEFLPELLLTIIRPETFSYRFCSTRCLLDWLSSNRIEESETVTQ